jgi:hypothetical protein
MRSKALLLFLVLITLLSLVACQRDNSINNTTPALKEEMPGDEEIQSTTYPGSSSQNLQTPGAEAEPYPSSQQPSIAQDAIQPYPDLEDGAELAWFQAENLIMQGYVAQVVQTHELKVLLTLKDGRTLIAYEPNIDDVLKVIESCGENCDDVVVATE